MKVYDSVMRAIFDSTASGLNNDIRSHLADIDEQAAKIRKNGGHPQSELADTVTTFKVGISKFTREWSASLKQELDQTRSEWQKQRQKNATAALLELEEARQHIGTLDDDSIKQMAMEYATDTRSLNLSELREMQIRLRHNGGDPELGVMKDRMIENRAEEPWIQTDEDRQKANYADSLDSLAPGQVMFAAEGSQVICDIEQLIDFDGELSQPA